MERIKPKKSDIPEGVGMLISDLIEHLQRKGYSITAQQVRQYEERDHLFNAIRTAGKYREYTPFLINTIEFIIRLEMVGYSKKWIKNFFILRKQIEEPPLVTMNQVWDEASGEAFYKLRRSIEAQKGSTEYLKLQMLVNRFRDMCEDIRERFESMKKIMDIGIQDIDCKKTTIAKLME